MLDSDYQVMAVDMDFVVEIAPNSDEYSVVHQPIGLREVGPGLVDLEPIPGLGREIGIVAADLADLFAIPVAADLTVDPLALSVLMVPVVD